MKDKTIAFERWLINNYPDREDNPEYECLECEGDGILLGKDCFSCCGTGSSMYDEYQEQWESDQELLRNFLEGEK